MKKPIEQKPQDEQVLDVLKRLTKRIEETTVDIHSIKFDVKAMKLDVGFMQSDFAIMKVDMEKMREELDDKLSGVEDRLGKRILHVADLITISMDQKFRTIEKKIRKIEHIQQSA